MVKMLLAHNACVRRSVVSTPVSRKAKLLMVVKQPLEEEVCAVAIGGRYNNSSRDKSSAKARAAEVVLAAMVVAGLAGKYVH